MVKDPDLHTDEDAVLLDVQVPNFEVLRLRQELKDEDVAAASKQLAQSLAPIVEEVTTQGLLEEGGVRGWMELLAGGVARGDPALQGLTLTLTLSPSLRLSLSLRAQA